MGQERDWVLDFSLAGVGGPSWSPAVSKTLDGWGQLYQCSKSFSGKAKAYPPPPGGKEASSDCLLHLQGWVGKRPAPSACSLSPRAVKALCHHIATEAGQLSFKKGDVLRVLGRVDADWLRCSRREGADSGLVPIMYVTHLEDADY